MSGVLGPFATGSHPVYGEIGATDAASRIQMVRRFGREQCIQALGMSHLQTTVRAAVARRLRQIERERA